MLCAIRARAVGHLRQELLQAAHRLADAPFIVEIPEQAGPRGPAVENGRALEAEVVGQLCRPHRGVVEADVVAVDEDERLLPGRCSHRPRDVLEETTGGLGQDRAQHDVLSGVRAELEPPERGTLDLGRLVHRRDADLDLAVVGLALVGPDAEVAHRAVLGRSLPVGRIEHADDGEARADAARLGCGRQSERDAQLRRPRTGADLDRPLIVSETRGGRVHGVTPR
jgi:hypothetical protein